MKNSHQKEAINRTAASNFVFPDRVGSRQSDRFHHWSGKLFLDELDDPS